MEIACQVCRFWVFEQLLKYPEKFFDGGARCTACGRWHDFKAAQEEAFQNNQPNCRAAA